jgi:hypothetical protein
MAGVTNFTPEGPQWKQFADEHAKADGLQKDSKYVKDAPLYAKKIVQAASHLSGYKTERPKAIGEAANESIKQAVRENDEVELDHKMQALYSLPPDAIKQLELDKKNGLVEKAIAKFLYNCPENKKEHANAAWKAFQGTIPEKERQAEIRKLKREREGLIIEALTKEKIKPKELHIVTESLKKFAPLELASLFANEKLETTSLMLLVGRVEERNQGFLFKAINRRIFSPLSEPQQREIIDHIRRDAESQGPQGAAFSKLAEFLESTLKKAEPKEITRQLGELGLGSEPARSSTPSPIHGAEAGAGVITVERIDKSPKEQQFELIKNASPEIAEKFFKGKSGSWISLLDYVGKSGGHEETLRNVILEKFQTDRTDRGGRYKSPERTIEHDLTLPVFMLKYAKSDEERVALTEVLMKLLETVPSKTAFVLEKATSQLAQEKNDDARAALTKLIQMIKL